MSKIGSYYLPDIQVSQALDIVGIIYKNSISTEAALAAKLGHSTVNSGGFFGKLATLRQLGLIKSGSGGIELTELGSKLARPVAGEETQAFKELTAKLPLFSELRKKLNGKNPDKDALLVALMDITKLNRSELDKELLKIQKLYNDVDKYYPSISESENLMSGIGGSLGMDTTNNVGQGSKFLEIKSGDLYMRLPQSLEAIEEAKFILTAREEMLKKKSKG